MTPIKGAPKSKAKWNTVPKVAKLKYLQNKLEEGIRWDWEPEDKTGITSSKLKLSIT